MTIRERVLSILHGVENYTAVGVLLLLTLFPAIEVFARKLINTGVPYSTDYLKHLVLWVAFIGGMITSREDNHLNISVSLELMKGRTKEIVRIVIAVVSSMITFALFWSSLSFVFRALESSMTVGIFPIKAVMIIMPVGYLVMALRFIVKAPGGARGKALSSIGLLLGVFLAYEPIVNLIAYFIPSVPSGLIDSIQPVMSMAGSLALPLIIVLILVGLLGMPVFIILGGVAYLMFVRTGGSLEVIPNEAYTVLTSDALPAIPLFTLVGIILAESKSGERLLALFRSLFGWLPGGMVVMIILVCAFFTTFTGASGVTILALGGLLFYILSNSTKLPESFNLGLLTASGSIGLLFPPSLPIILYGVVAQISIKKMFVGGLLPGVVMVVVLSVYGIIMAMKHKVERVPFQPKEALAATGKAAGEIVLPAIILVGFLGGLFTIVESGAIAALYVLVLTMVVHRDIKPADLPRVVLKCVPIIGGILVILAVSRGLSYYIIDVEAPQHLSDWVRLHIHSQFVFLIILNIMLLITGCLMDIFSAIVVVVPLIIPMSQVFNIDPVHLGIIFLANLELGYLTPPVGLNLFLASYCFNKPLGTVYRYAVPFFLVMLISLVLITYVPWFSTGLLSLFTW